MSVRSNVWSFTVNTRKNVNLLFLDKLVKYITKCPGGYICREKPNSDKEHIHGLVIYNDVRHKDSVNKQFSRMMECIPSEEYEFKRAVELNPVYNDDWRKKYLTKAEDTIVDYDKILEIEYCTQIVKRESSKDLPLSQRILAVCQEEEATSYKDIRITIFKYLRNNEIPPPRMDQVNSMIKSIYCYMNIENEDLINKLPVPEGFEKPWSGVSRETMKNIKFSLY